MRDLFLSERRYIANILAKCAGIRSEIRATVEREYYAPPRTASKVRFNTDFFLQLVADERLKSAETKAYGAAVLPNTIGVDAFLLVDAVKAEPLMTELLGGEGLPMRYFKKHIETIEHRLTELSRPLKLRRASYCRIFVIENDICFLVFARDAAPVIRGSCELLCADAESSIACRMDGDELVCVDGWIRTLVPQSEWKLTAIPS